MQRNFLLADFQRAGAATVHRFAVGQGFFFQLHGKLDAVAVGKGHERIFGNGQSRICLRTLHGVLAGVFYTAGIIHGVLNQRSGIVHGFGIGVAIFAIQLYPQANTQGAADFILVDFLGQDVHRKVFPFGFVRFGCGAAVF